jgi:glycosyltransferase involved in cell wall biosynthesis
MKILVVTNLYPPYYHGGYEVRCAQVADAMQVAGHTVQVLTSRYGVSDERLEKTKSRTAEPSGVHVHRILNQYLYPPQPAARPWRIYRARRELDDVREFGRILREFRPDVVNWWSMYGLSKLLLPVPSRSGTPDVHWIEHWWMISEYSRRGEDPATFWSALWEGTWGPRMVRPVLHLLGRAWERRVEREGILTREFPNRPTHVCFVSEHMRTLHRGAGLQFPSSEVIHGGVPVEQFYQPLAARRGVADRLRILYVGQMTPDRGLHTVIEALAQLQSASPSRIVLSVAGGGQEDYERQVRAQVDELHLTERVTFLGRVPHAAMPALYKEHDLLVFPSMRDEGLPLTMVEAMLAGCAVATTGSGGAVEVATAAELPLFPKGDAAALARILAFMAAHPEKVLEVASRGQNVAVKEFSFDRMMERWLGTLSRIHQGALAMSGAASPGRGMASELP